MNWEHFIRKPDCNYAGSFTYLDSFTTWGSLESLEMKLELDRGLLEAFIRLTTNRLFDDVNLFSATSSFMIMLHLPDIMQLSSNSFLDYESNFAESEQRWSICYTLSLPLLQSTCGWFGFMFDYWLKLCCSIWLILRSDSSKLGTVVFFAFFEVVFRLRSKLMML